MTFINAGAVAVDMTGECIIATDLPDERSVKGRSSHFTGGKTGLTFDNERRSAAANREVETSMPIDDKGFRVYAGAPIAANQEFVLNIRASGNTPVTAWQIGIDFAEDSLQILEVLPGNSGEDFSIDNFDVIHLASGEFRALNYHPGGGATNLNNKILFGLRVKALLPVKNAGQRFRLKNAILQEHFPTMRGKTPGLAAPFLI